MGFVEDELLGFLWSKQREIALSVEVNRRTAVPSCHSSGKTGLAGRLVCWWMSVWPVGEASAVTLAPTGAQLKGQVWREINALHRAHSLPGHTNQIEWWINGQLLGVGRSPDDNNGTSLQGYHTRRVLVILEEACGIGPALVEAAESLATGADCRMLAIGNPDDPNTEFAAMCKPGSGWNTIPISAFDTPNFTGEEVPQWMREVLVSKQWEAERRQKLGESSPVYISKVLGRFPEQSTDSLISLTDLAAAVGRVITPGPENELGVDVSRFGGDYTTIVHRLGSCAKIVDKDQKRDLMHVVGMCVQAITRTGARKVKIDDIGLGGGVTDRLREMKREGLAALQGCEIVPVNVGAPVIEAEERTKKPGAIDDRGDLIFKNLKMQLSWQIRDRFVEGRVSILPPDLPFGRVGDNDDLLSQIGQVKYNYRSDGVLIMEDKAEMKKRLKGRSPDDWDAFVLALAELGDDGMEVWRRLGS